MRLSRECRSGVCGAARRGAVQMTSGASGCRHWAFDCSLNQHERMLDHWDETAEQRIRFRLNKFWDDGADMGGRLSLKGPETSVVSTGYYAGNVIL